MVLPNNNPKAARPPTVDDLITVCRKLNEKGVKYILIGGMVMNHYGFTRATQDIDLLVDPSDANTEKIKQALSFLQDNAVKEVAAGDVEKYTVVRVADEITIDLMKKACDVTYKDAGVKYYQTKGVIIPIADIPTMIKTKQGVRPKDKEDLKYLLILLSETNKIEQTNKQTEKVKISHHRHF